MKQLLFTLLAAFIYVAALSQQDSTFTPLSDSSLPLPYRLVKTTGALPFLEYGLGDDRLGGAKMTYLDSNILLKVVDSVDGDYKVQLSQSHCGYISKSNVQLLPDTATMQPWYLSSSWRVAGNDKEDYVSVFTGERLPYRAVQKIHPARIEIELFGVTTNTNWITQLNTTKEIKNAWYEQEEDDVMRVIIELKHDHHWGYGISYDKAGKHLIIHVKRQPERLRLKDLTIAIDPGHGGTNIGATGVTSRVKEKNYTLLFAKALQKQLARKHVKIVMTRTVDTTMSMVERTVLLREANPNCLISIHLNSSANPTVEGTSTYYRYIGFRPLTEAILGRMLDLGLGDYGNVGNFNFSLSGPTEYPNCLVEVAFLSNVEDEKRILDPSFHKAVAKQIYKGLKDWLKAMRRE